jgi:FkbM family methyltransferase
MFLEQLRKLVVRSLEQYDRLKLRRLGSGVEWHRVANRFEMRLDPQDTMDRAYYLSTYDPRLTWLIGRWVRPGDHCVDAGAQKGYVTLHLATRVGPEGRVFAFEPDPRARAGIIENCQRNGCKQVRIFPYAAGKTSGTSIFKLSSQLGWSTQFPNEEAKQTIVSEVEVSVRALDELIAAGEMSLDHHRLSFVKIDCEGAEPFVLAGMHTILRGSAPLVWIEINEGALRIAGQSLATIREQLKELGYSLFLPRYNRLFRGRKRLSFVSIATLAQDMARDSVFDVVAVKGAATRARLGQVSAVIE